LLERAPSIKLFVIDSLQVLHSTSRQAENRQQEIADISNGIKALAKELKAPLIVLNQLNRELEKDITAGRVQKRERAGAGTARPRKTTCC